MVTRWIVPLWLALATTAGAQTPAAPATAKPPATPATAKPETVETEPLRCWWRTDAGAVRVGEIFSVVLTCSVVETGTVTVVPNLADLDPSTLQLPPFEVTGGTHGTDIRTADHRFIQYDYRVRVVSEGLFEKEAKLPELKISYKVRSRVDADSVEGRDQLYLLPPLSIRVLSLVPADAADIRDASPETFAEIDSRQSRANLLRLVGTILFGLALVPAIVAFVRLVSRTRRRGPEARALVSNGSILRHIGRELSAIQRARGGEGWTHDLAARLITALRLISAQALNVPARPLPAEWGAKAVGGHLTVRSRVWRGTKVTLPAWVTPSVIAEEVARLTAGDRPRRKRVEVLEELEEVLTRLTTAQYGRATTLDESALDEALTFGFRALRRLKVENIWVVRQLRSLGQFRSELGHRVWSR